MRKEIRRPLAIVGALGFSAGAMSIAAAAEPPPEPVVLVIRGSECGEGFSSAFFSDERVRPATSGEASREFEVSFVREPNGALRGQLVIRDGIHMAKREVRGRDCSDTTRSLVLIARLALDEGGAAVHASQDAGVPGDAAEGGRPEPRPDVQPARPIVSVLDASRTEPAKADVAATADADTTAAEAAVARPALAPAPHAVAEGDLVVGVRAAALAAPSFVIAPELGFERRGEVASVPLVAGAGFSLGLPSEIAEANGAARLTWFLPELRLCVGALRWGERLVLEPCGRVEVGALSATGLRVSQAQSDVRFWVAPSVSARLRWRFAKNVWLGAEGGLTAPLIREEFVVARAAAGEPVVLYRPPMVAAFFGLSLRLTIF